METQHSFQTASFIRTTISSRVMYSSQIQNNYLHQKQQQLQLKQNLEAHTYLSEVIRSYYLVKNKNNSTQTNQLKSPIRNWSQLTTAFLDDKNDIFTLNMDLLLNTFNDLSRETKISVQITI